MWDTSDQRVLIGGLKPYEYDPMQRNIPAIPANQNHPIPIPIPNLIINQTQTPQNPTIPITHHIHSQPVPNHHQHVNASFEEHYLPNSKHDTYNKQVVSQKTLPDGGRFTNNQNEKRFPCRFCPQTFSRTPYLKRHERKHTGERIITCQICRKGFRDNGYFKRHMDSHTLENKYRCERGCGMTFKSYNGWRKHTNKGGDECPKRRAPTVKSTKTTNIKERTFICNLQNCDKSYKTRSELVSHQRRHTGEKPFQCLICQVRSSQTCSFFTKRGLKVHILREHSVNGIYVDEKGQTVVLKSFKCEICGKSFYFSGDLKKHVFIHENKKPYICTYCGKSFNKSNTLKWHLNLHLGLKPYKCKTCSRAFSAKANLNTHEKTHEEDRPRLFQCTECDKSFMTNRSLRIHRIGHSKDKPFNCAECQRGFNQRSHFKDHMKMHANELKFKCKKCPKAYNVKSRLKKHILYNHPQYSSDEEESPVKEPIIQPSNPDSDVDCPDEPPVDMHTDTEVENKERNSVLELNLQAVPVITRNETNLAFYQIPFMEPPNPSIAVPVPLNQQACSYTEEPTFISVGPFCPNNLQQVTEINQNQISIHHNQTSQDISRSIMSNRQPVQTIHSNHPIQNEFTSSINMAVENHHQSSSSVVEDKPPCPIVPEAVENNQSTSSFVVEKPPCPIVPEAASSASLYVVKMRSYTDRPPEVIEFLKKATQFNMSLLDRSSESSDEDPLSDNPVFKDSFRKPKNGVEGPLNKYNLKRFFCSKCNQGFSRTSSLKRHERTHTGERPFTCESCGKGFNDKSHYKTHQFTHSQEKQFACEKCGRKFKSYGGYRTHVKNDVCATKPAAGKSRGRKRINKRDDSDDDSTETSQTDDESQRKQKKNVTKSLKNQTNSRPENSPENNSPSNVPTRRSLRNRERNNIVYFSDSSSECND